MKEQLTAQQEDLMLESGLEKWREQREKDGYPDIAEVKCSRCCEKFLDVDTRKDEDGEILCNYCYEDLALHSA